MKTTMKVWAPVGTFVVVLAVGGAAALLTQGDGDGTPRQLPIAVSGTRDAASLSSGGANGAYTLTGTLPSGTPADAPAWTLSSGPADAAHVARLATALGAPTPVRDGTGWRAGGLVVSGETGQVWYFSPCGPDSPVSSDGSRDGVSCAVDVGTGSSGGGGTATSGTVTAEPVPGSSGGTKPSDGSTTSPDQATPPSAAPEPSPIAAQVVRNGTAAVLTALGLDPTAARITTSGYGGSAAVDRKVAGLDVGGMTTRVDVDRKGAVSSGTGWLGAATKADSYPLISAKEAFDALPGPVRMLSCPIGPDGKGCLEPPPAEVTGAHLGLSLQHLVSGEQLLVPSWLFDVKGYEEPVAGVAVEPRFLGSGTPTPDPGTPDPGSTKPGSTGPGGTEPVPPPVSGGPGSGPDDPAPARGPLAFDSAYRAGTPNAVVVQYGDSSSCPHENVTHVVKESADSVVVVLEADTMQSGIACTDDYRVMKVTVALQAPLGDRTVVDGATGKPVALS